MRRLTLVAALVLMAAILPASSVVAADSTAPVSPRPPVAESPDSSSPKPAEGQRTSCSTGSIPVGMDNLSGDVADTLEAHQATYENLEGFRSVLFDGQSYWVVAAPGATALVSKAEADGLRVATSCVSDVLVDAANQVVEAAKHEEGDSSVVGYDVFIDAVFVTTTLDASSLTSDIVERASKSSPTVTVSGMDGPGLLRVASTPKDSASRLTRSADSTPFFGGGQILIGGAGGPGCSTGFYINSSTKGTVMVTAGHCFYGYPVGVVVTNGNATHNVGVLDTASLPDPDLAVIDGQTYSARSFSAANNTSSKAISASANPATGTTYCNLGATSLRVCSSYSSLNTTFTDDLGTTTQLAYTSRLCSAGTLGQPGDSGGGVFLETTGGNLSARASVVAGGVKAIPQPAMCFRQDHKRQTIMSFFNATVVTS